MTSPVNREKKNAGVAAIEYVESGMHLGLGTGSTAEYAIHELGRRFKEGELRVTAVATSLQSEAIAREYDIPIKELDPARAIDLYIDGADEVDPRGCLTKGGGGALFREKMVARHATRRVIVVDTKKRVEKLGAFPLPVDVVPFGHTVTRARIAEAAGCEAVLRLRDGRPFLTSDGNNVVDCHFTNRIQDPEVLESLLKTIPGVIDCGLFIGLCDEIIVGTQDGVEKYQIT